MDASANGDERERFKELFLQAAAAEADSVAGLLAQSGDGDLLGKAEFALRDAVHRLGAKTLEAAANERAKKGGVQGSSVACACVGSARFVSWRSKRVVSLLGPLTLACPYYHCVSCGVSDGSWQGALRLGARRLSAAAEELVALAGCLRGFEEAAEKTLRKLAGVRLSESTVRRTTENAGARLRQLLERQVNFQAPEAWSWSRGGAHLRLCERRRHGGSPAGSRRRPGRRSDGVCRHARQPAPLGMRRGRWKIVAICGDSTT